MFFLLILLDDYSKDPDPYLVQMDPDPGGQDQKRTDPQHWFQVNTIPGTQIRTQRSKTKTNTVLHAVDGLYDSYLHDSLQVTTMSIALHKNTKWSSFDNGCLENYKMVSFNCTWSVLAKNW